MKRKLIVLAGVVVLGVGAYVGTQLWAQTPTAAPCPASPKIGMVNLAHVLKNYNKFKLYNDEIEKIRLQYEKQENDLKKMITDWQKFGQRTEATQKDREQAEDAIKTCQRRIEDNVAEYKKVRGKKSDEQMVQMYREFEQAVKTYAASNGFHMIFHHSEPLTDADKLSPTNIQRKLVGPGSSGGVCPVYFAPGMDVSQDVVNTLNTMFPAPATAAAAGASGTSH